MDKFVLVTQGTEDISYPGIVRVPPDCYRRVAELKRKTGLSMCRIIEQCVEFALEHMEGE